MKGIATDRADDLAAYVENFENAKRLPSGDFRTTLVELAELGEHVAPVLWKENAEGWQPGTDRDPHEIIVRRARLALNRRERIYG